MQTTRLGRTGLEVSRLCLGTMQFGWTADRDTAFAVLDAFFEAGGNFVDTADIYSRWAEDNPGGVSEEIIGAWMQARDRRQDVVLATKVRGRMWEGPNGEGLSRAHIVRAVEDSLRRLDTDYIDLYQTHWYDDATSIEETMQALDDLQRAGKIIYAGCSNYPAWMLTHSLWVSDLRRLMRYESLQPHYNLANRAGFEREHEALCTEFGLGVIPYSPLAGGFLTGKYRAGSELPDSARAERIRARYMNPSGFALLDGLDAIAEAHGASVAQVALTWLLARPVVTAPIVGANSVEQLEELLPAVELELGEEELARLDELSEWREDG